MLIAMAGALWVALVASIAALIGATVSPLSTWLIARSQRGAERRGRTYSDKRIAYGAVLRDAYSDALRLSRAVTAIEEDAIDNEDAKEIVEVLHQSIRNLPDEEALIAELALVAPEHVIDAHAAFIHEWNAALEKIRGVDRIPADANIPIGFRGHAAYELGESSAAVSDRLKKLRQAIRDDVTG